MKKNIYLVVGTIYAEDYTDTIVNDYAVHSTIEGAHKELQRILAETDKEAREHDVPYTHEMKENMLVISWTETLTEEYWVIHEKELDKAE